jgi:hypothetical protein
MRFLKFLLCGFTLLLSICLIQPKPLWAGPVDWQEVNPTSAGKQWWDKGSLRLNRKGELTVLSRFSPSADASSKTASGKLFVMALDCDERLYKDLQVNGLPRPHANWQLVGAEDLIAEVLEQACSSASNRGLLAEKKA